MRRAQVFAAFGILALSATGCGAIAEQALEAAVEKGVEASADGEDVEFDLDLSEGKAEVQIGDSVGAVGADLDPPDWLDDDFDLPDGLSILMHSNESELGQSVITGHIENADIAELTDQQRDAVNDLGYELIEGWGSESSFRAVASDGRMVEVATLGVSGEVSQYAITFYREDSSQAQRAVEQSNRVEGIGTANAMVADIELELRGSCTIEGESAQFYSDDNQISANVSRMESGIRSDITVTDMSNLEMPAIWIALQQDQTFDIDDDGFTFSGEFTNMFDGETTTTGSVTVDCS